MLAEPHRTLPGLGTPVSAIGAGCWAIGGPATNRGAPIGWDDVDPRQAVAGLHRAHELGITLYDTADVYGLGQSERLLGQFLREVDRSRLVISSKVGYFAGTASHPYEPRQLHHQFATTLANLGTDHLDLYVLHSTDYGSDDRYLPAAVKIMRELRRHGRIRAIGMRAPHAFAEEWSTHPGLHAAATTRWLHLFNQIQPDILTVRYNLFSPRYDAQETDIFAFARRHHVGVLIKQALHQGLLLRDPTRPPRRFSAADHRSRDPAFAPAALTRLDATLAALRHRFGDSTKTIARIALRYALHRDPAAPVLVGFRNPAQITATLTSLGEPLSQDELDAVTELLPPGSPRQEPRAIHRS